MRFSVEQIPSQPWKNGGGTTREIACLKASDAKDSALIWRASLAQIDQDGAFSPFPGLSRIHCIISGKGLRLRNKGLGLSANPLVPLHFAGDLALMAQLNDGPCKALNLIYNPLHVRAEMQILEAGPHVLGEGATLLLVLAEEARMEQEGSLTKGQGFYGELTGSVQVAKQGRVALVRLRPC